MHKNSKCIPGYLHAYRIRKQYPDGMVEVCMRCKHKKYFKNTTPNHVYLSYHQRSALQKDHKRFDKEYGQLPQRISNQG